MLHPPLHRLLPLVCAVSLLAACGSDHGGRGPGAAEPATAPPTSAAPAGSVVHVAPEPEGIVYDPTTRLVAVAVHDPDRLLLLDPRTLAVRRTVTLPGSARHLQLGADDTVLVPAETANELVQVPLGGGANRVTAVRKQPHDATAVAGGRVVVGDEFGQAASIVRAGRVERTITGLTQPGGVIGDGATVLVVDVGAFTLGSYDVATGRRTRVVAAGAGPTHGELLSGGRVAVTDTRGDALLVFTVDPLRRVARLALPGTPYGMAVDRTTGLLWVTLTARNQLVGLDVSGGVPKVVARYATVRQPNTVAVAPGSHTLWVTGTAGGVVQRISR